MPVIQLSDLHSLQRERIWVDRLVSVPSRRAACDWSTGLQVFDCVLALGVSPPPAGRVSGPRCSQSGCCRSRLRPYGVLERVAPSAPPPRTGFLAHNAPACLPSHLFATIKSVRTGGCSIWKKGGFTEGPTNHESS